MFKKNKKQEYVPRHSALTSLVYIHKHKSPNLANIFTPCGRIKDGFECS